MRASQREAWGRRAGLRGELVAMQEQSQIDEMRAAVRGDRERAEQSRKTLENVLSVSAPAAETRLEPAPQERRSLLSSLFRRS